MAHIGEVSSRRQDGEDAVGVHVVDFGRRRRGVVDILGACHHRGGVGVATGGRELAVLHGKRVERVEAHVEDGAAVQLGEIGQQEFARILHRGREGLEGELLGLLHLRGDTLPVLAVSGILLELERVSLTFLILLDSVVELRHALYLGEENLWPSWSSTRSSSTHVTSGVASLEMDATMQLWGSSLSTSSTSKPGPKCGRASQRRRERRHG